MALSDAEKETNKLERRLRDRTHTARLRALQSAEAAAEAEVRARHEDRCATSAEAVKAVEDERDAARADIDAQIIALQERRKAVLDEFGERYSAVRAVERQAFDDRREDIDAALKSVQVDFPDMENAGRYSAVCWGSTDAGKALIEEARAVQQAACAPAGPRR